MKPGDYRKKVAAQIQDAVKRTKKSVAALRDGGNGSSSSAASLEGARDQAAAKKVVTDRSAKAELRASVLARLGSLIATDPSFLKTVIKMVGTDEEPVVVRTAALSVLKAASFHVRDFGHSRPAYVAALRKAAEVEDPMLRERALGVLAREKDGSTLKRLEQGLREPAKALVSAEKALQLLSYDTKRNRALLTSILENPPSEEARYQALRNLAADAASKPAFEAILKNRRESKQARLIAMAALQSLEPERLHELSGDIVTDDTEEEDIRAAGLVAAATFGHGAAAAGALKKGAEKMQASAGSEATRAVARKYLSRTSTPDEPDEA